MRKLLLYILASFLLASSFGLRARLATGEEGRPDIQLKVEPFFSEFFPGEPVVLVAKFENKGTAVGIVNLGHTTMEAYLFKIYDQKGRLIAQPKRVTRRVHTGIGWKEVSEQGAPLKIEPGKTLKHGIILDRVHAIKSPGTYRIVVKVSKPAEDGFYFTDEDEDLCSAECRIKILAKDDPDKIKQRWQVYYNQRPLGLLTEEILSYFRSPAVVPLLKQYFIQLTTTFKSTIELGGRRFVIPGGPCEYLIEGLGRIGNYEATEELKRIWKEGKDTFPDLSMFALVQIAHIRKRTKDKRILELTEECVPEIKAEKLEQKSPYVRDIYYPD